jgi:aspartate-semialdehyde dehydrogenase
MKILKKAISDYRIMKRKAQSNYSKGKNGNNYAQTENDVYEVWDINKAGNVFFDGYLKAATTWYPEAPSAGFLVYDAQQAMQFTRDEEVKGKVPQDILEEILNIQNEYRNL